MNWEVIATQREQLCGVTEPLFQWPDYWTSKRRLRIAWCSWGDGPGGYEYWRRELQVRAGINEGRIHVPHISGLETCDGGPKPRVSWENKMSSGLQEQNDADVARVVGGWERVGREWAASGPECSAGITECSA